MKEVLNTKNKSKVRQTKTALARKLGVSRGMLYYQHRMKVTDEALRENIEVVMDQNESYGHKRIALELKLNKKRILRVMKKFHLIPKRRRGKKPTKLDDLGKPETKYPNLIETFCPIRANVVWAGDFTHIKFQNSWVYLSTVMDIYTREILGWHLSTNHQKNLVIEAFLDAMEKRKLTPIYFHSDQGSEYDSEEYLKLLENNQIIISMSRKSHPWENGYQESFYSGFKLDLGSTNHFQDLGELFEAIARQIHYYNTKRIHTRLKTAPEKFRLDREYLFKEMGT
jgi:transposase InsO family protein